jgi:hypothetical protein
MKIYEELKQLEFFKWLDEVHNLADTDMKPEYLDKLPIDDIHRTVCNAMVFRWFRENHGLHFSIEEHELILGQSTENYDPLEEQAVVYLARVEEAGYIKQLNTYEEAEFGCLIAMIKLVKEKQK